MVWVDFLEVKGFHLVYELLFFLSLDTCKALFDMAHKLLELLVLVHDYILHVPELNLLLDSLLHGCDLIADLLALLLWVFFWSKSFNWNLLFLDFLKDTVDVGVILLAFSAPLHKDLGLTRCMALRLTWEHWPIIQLDWLLFYLYILFYRFRGRFDLMRRKFRRVLRCFGGLRRFISMWFWIFFGFCISD